MTTYETFWRRCFSVRGHWLLAMACACVPLLNAHAATDGSAQALTYFLSAEGIHRSGDAPGTLKNSEADVVADILVGWRHGRWRLLGEIVLSPDEQEIERLQLGYEPSDNMVFWLGRFHQPASVWNIFYHHGQFLQTSITRPWIENWEDEGGVVPQHVVGALFESQFSAGKTHGWRINAGIGLTPSLQQTALKPFDQFSNTNSRAGPHAGLRLEWLPDPVGEDTIGLIASHAEMPVNRTDRMFGRHIDHSLYGGFFSLSSGPSRAIGTIYVLELHSDDATLPPQGRQVAGYLQYDYSLAASTTLYARHELLSNANSSTYLAQFPNVMTRRSLAGLRWQLHTKNALSLELSRNATMWSAAFTEARIQWSAALP